MGSKKMICSKCKKITDERCFATFRIKSGEIRRRGICKTCRGQYAHDNFERLKLWRQNYNRDNRSRKRERDAIRRRAVKEIVNAIKSKTPCADCGRTFPAVAMDFDHIKSKNRGVSNLVGGAYRIELILAEIALCDIVCACCHRIRTASRGQNHAPRKGESNAHT